MMHLSFSAFSNFSVQVGVGAEAADALGLGAIGGAARAAALAAEATPVGREATAEARGT